MKKVFILLLCCLISVNMTAQSVNQNMKIVVIKFIHDGNLTYSYSLKGVEDHLESLSIQKEKNETYQALRPLVKRMKDKKRNSIVFSAVLGSIGFGISGYGGYVVSTTPSFSGNAINDEHQMGITLIGVGAFSGLIGIFVPQYINLSNQQDGVMKYINQYNILNPDKPLEVY